MSDPSDIRALAGYVNDTPERYVPALMAETEIEAEHLARYRWAMALARGRRILDAGCGTGYGARLLLEAGAAAVVGIDTSPSAIHAARLAAPGASLLVGDIRTLPFEDASFDLVVAFELLEHVLPQERVIGELKRVLVSDGVLVISSPNRNVTVPGNPHHLHELAPDEFERLLCGQFRYVESYRQHNWVASVLADEAAAVAVNSPLDLTVRKTKALARGDELYMVALASNEPLPTVAGVAYLAPTEQLRKWVERVTTLEERVATLEQALGQRNAELAARDAADRAKLWRRLRAQLSMFTGRWRGGIRLGRDLVSEPGRRLRTRNQYRGGLAAILFVSGAPDVSVRYRCDHQAEQLALLGGTTTFVRHGDCDLVDALERHELVVLHRVPWGDDVARLMDRADQVGKEVLFDTDDLVFEPDVLDDVAVLSELPSDEAQLYVEGVHRYRSTLERCKGATTSTGPLTERIRGLGVPAVTTPNVASNAMVETAERLVETRLDETDQPQRVVVGYLSGTETHRKDFASAAEAVVGAMSDRPDTELRIVGPLKLDVPLGPLDGRATFMPLQPWSHLATVQASIDVNLAPLEPDNAFTECKSAIKWLEAALVARPTVASPRPDFRRVIRAGDNGFLAESPGEWHEAVSALLNDSGLRQRVGDRAREDALKAHTTKAQCLSYLAALRRLTSRPEAPLTINWLLYSPIPQSGGGYRNIFRIASVLGERGHRQRLIVKPVAHLHGMSRTEVVQFLDDAFGIPHNADVLIEHHEIPEADVSLATYWPTAYTVAEHRLSRFKGYFIQDFEPSFHEDSPHDYRRAEQTYSLPLRHICLGEHLAHRIQDLTGAPSASVDFALDPHFRMTRRPAERGARPSVLFFARPSLPRRGYEVGVDALAKLKRRHPNVDIVFFGSPTEELGVVPFQFRNLGLIDAATVAQAMTDAHILLTLSLTNISNVPFEGMACGCSVVEVDSANVSSMTAPGENCLLAPFEASAIADALSRLIETPDLRIQLGERGAADMAGRDWERTGSMFESALREFCFLPALGRCVGQSEFDDIRVGKPR